MNEGGTHFCGTICFQHSNNSIGDTYVVRPLVVSLHQVLMSARHMCGAISDLLNAQSFYSSGAHLLRVK